MPSAWPAALFVRTVILAAEFAAAAPADVDDSGRKHPPTSPLLKPPAIAKFSSPMICNACTQKEAVSNMDTITPEGFKSIYLCEACLQRELSDSGTYIGVLCDFCGKPAILSALALETQLADGTERQWDSFCTTCLDHYEEEMQKLPGENSAVTSRQAIIKQILRVKQNLKLRTGDV